MNRAETRRIARAQGFRRSPHKGGRRSHFLEPALKPWSMFSLGEVRAARAAERELRRHPLAQLRLAGRGPEADRTRSGLYLVRRTLHRILRGTGQLEGAR
jgi:hypothetical protein